MANNPMQFRPTDEQKEQVKLLEFLLNGSRSDVLRIAVDNLIAKYAPALEQVAEKQAAAEAARRELLQSVEGG